MSLQQIAKELHVELVVFHDQDGLGHPGTPSANADHSPPPAHQYARTPRNLSAMSNKISARIRSKAVNLMPRFSAIPAVRCLK
jgi:hypothetical protein